MPSTTRARVAGAVLALLLAAGAAGITAVRAEPTPHLPPVGADELLASALRAAAAPPTLSGTVRTHVDLGVPTLPDVPAAGQGTAAASMLLGDQTFRLWRSPDGIRVSHLGRFQEQVLVANHAEAWAWDSQSLTAVRLTRQGLAEAVPGQLVRSAEDASRSVPHALGDPIEIARMLLEGVRPYADAGVATPESVAGRDAYILSLRPRSDDTLVGSIEVAIDAETRLPLRLQIVPRNALDPSIEIGFSTIDFDPIDPSMFVFDPPAEATVTDAGPALGRILDEATTGGHARREALREVRDALPAMRVYGKGFGLVVAARLSEVPRELRAMLPYSGPLASAALVDREQGAWLVAGAVTPDALSAVQSRLP